MDWFTNKFYVAQLIEFNLNVDLSHQTYTDDC